MKTTLKPGPISNKERQYVAENNGTSTVTEIATHLRRSEEVVRKLIGELPAVVGTQERSDWVLRLRISSFWPAIRDSLLDNEVKYFEQKWASYMKQFASSSDILATDESMIEDLVMSEIFANRATKKKAMAERRMSELEDAIDTEEHIDDESRDVGMLKKLRTQLAALQAAHTATTKRYIDYQQRKDTKLRDLKGARDQRFKQMEERGKNIFELITDLDKEASRVKEGLENAKVQLAAALTRDDWNQIIPFEDGMLDKPYLSPEGELQDARLQNEQE